MRARTWAYVFACFERGQSREGGLTATPDDSRIGSRTNHIEKGGSNVES